MEKEFKICSSCQQTLSLCLFNRKMSSSDGYQYICKDCSKLKNKSYYQDNKEVRKQKLKNNREFLNSLAKKYIIEQLSSGCVDCGEKDIIVLEFDHVSDIKEYNIAVMINHGYSVNTIAKELAKCEVRCANCHRRKTAKDFNWYKLCNIVT